MKHKLTERELDTVLREALFMEEEPGEALNQKILTRAKETTGMNRKMRRMTTAAAAGLLLFTGVSVSVYAGVKYLTPHEIAETVGGDTGEVIQNAFEGENAVYVNETKSFDGGTVTFLGIAQGSGVNALTGELSADNNRSYAVFAFDGDGFEDEEKSFFISPFIKGLAPWQYNEWTIGSDDDYGANGAFWMVKDGVRYHIVECGNVEMFADRGVYMGVSYSMGGSAFEMNAETGEIQPRAEYGDKAVIFTVPFDPAKADPAAADAVIEEIRKSFEEPSDNDETTGGGEESPLAEWNAERVLAEGKRLENTVSTVSADDKGMIPIPSWETEDGGTVCLDGGIIAYNYLFPDNKTGMSDMMFIIDGEEDDVLIETYTLNEDGTITFAVYQAKR